MSNDDYFDTTNPNPNETSTEDFVKRIVQDKGDQWSDPQVLAKGYVMAQDHIKNLEEQTASMREDLGKKTYAEDLIKQLRMERQPPITEPPVASQPTDGTNTGDTPSALSEEKLKSLITETLTFREQENTEQQNLKATSSKLTELFGTEVDKEVAKRAELVGMTKEQLQKIAAESPNAFFKLLGEEVKQESNPTRQGTLNTVTGFDHQTSTRDFKYYQALRRTNSKEYYSPKNQNLMLADRKELGDRFFSA